MKKLACLIVLIFSFALCLATGFLFSAFTHPIKYKAEIEKYASRYNLNSSLVASLINVESGFRNDVVSNKNAIGLMQIKLTTAEYMNELYKLNRTLTENDLYLPETNLEFGCLYLSYVIKKFENVNTALCAYNAGETIVRSWLKNENFSDNGISLKNIPYNETKNYVIKINKNIKFYNRVFN